MPVPLLCRFRSSAGIFGWHLPAQRETTTEVGYNAFLQGVVIVGATQEIRVASVAAAGLVQYCAEQQQQKQHRQQQLQRCMLHCSSKTEDCAEKTFGLLGLVSLARVRRGLLIVWVHALLGGGGASGLNGRLVVSMPERAFFVECL